MTEWRKSPAIPRRIGFLVDDLATWLVTGHQPTGIQRVVSELLDAGLARSDVVTIPLIAKPGLSTSGAPRLVSIERESLRWSEAAAASRGRTGIQLARRVTLRLPLGPLRRVARVLYLRSTLRFGGIDAAADQSPIVPDILVVAGGFWGGGASTRVARIADAGVDVRVVVYDLFPITHSQWYEPNLIHDFRAAMDEVLPRAGRVVTLSEEMAERIRELFPVVKDRVRVGVPTLRAHVPARPASAIAGDRLIDQPYVFALSTVEPRKNYRVIVDAWRRFKATGHNPEARLAVVGRRGWYADDVEREIERDGEALGIVRIARATDDDLEILYRDCHATVHASWTEGFGLPVRESVARGIPTFVSTGIPRDGLPDGAYETFDPADPERLASLFSAVLASERTRRNVDVGTGNGWEPVLSALIDE